MPHDKKINDYSPIAAVLDGTQFETDTGGITANKATGLQIKTHVLLNRVIGTDIQAFDIILEDLAALTAVADNEFIVGTGAGVYAHESGATVRTSLGLTIGTDVQAFDADTAKTDVAQEWTASQNFNATTLTGLGPDLVLDGDMTVSGSWTVQGTGWSIAAGVANSDATQSADSDLTQTPSTDLVNGNTYQTTITITNYVGGNVALVIGGTEGTDRSGNGTFTENIVAGAGADIDIRADLDGDFDIDDVSVKLANVSWNLQTDYITTLTLDGDLVIDNPSNMVDGMTPILRILQPSSGGPFTITLGSAYKFPGATAPTLSTGASDRDKICFDCDGTNMDGVFQGDFS